MIVACTGGGGPTTRGLELDELPLDDRAGVRKGRLRLWRCGVLGRDGRSRTVTDPREPTRGEKVFPPAAADLQGVAALGLVALAGAPDIVRKRIAVALAAMARTRRDPGCMGWIFLPLSDRPGCRRNYYPCHLWRP